MVMVPTLSSLLASVVVITTIAGVVTDDKVGIITTLDFQCVVGHNLISVKQSNMPDDNNNHTNIHSKRVNAKSVFLCDR